MKGDGQRGRRRDFDAQAGGYAKRVGLADETALAVARSVLKLAAINGGEWLVDVGPGTGEIGRHLAGLHDSYLGLDISLEMLREFRRGAYAQTASGATASVNLIAGDCEGDWPIGAGKVGLVFGSRVLHLFNPVHVVDEVSRLASDRCTVLMGRVRRDPAGFRELMRTKMQNCLEQHGVLPRPGRSLRRALLDGFAHEGWAEVAKEDVATWNVSGCPVDVLQGWSDKRSLGGEVVSDNIRAAVLNEVERWSVTQFGDLKQERVSPETYELEGVCRGR